MKPDWRDWVWSRIDRLIVFALGYAVAMAITSDSPRYTPSQQQVTLPVVEDTAWRKLTIGPGAPDWIDVDGVRYRLVPTPEAAEHSQTES